jgi:cytochrome c5
MNKKVKSMENRCVVRISKLLAIGITSASLMLAGPQQANAQGSERSGKEVVADICAACHGSGSSGAPKIGDKAAWASRASHGLTELSQNALNGVRRMPPHGGNPALSDNEIKRAIAHMVNESGGSWAEPISRTAPAAERTGEQVVRAHCFKCHEAGVGGAPKIGERAAWIPRVRQGMEVLVRSAINGHGGMVPRGGVASLTDAEIRAAVTFMLDPAPAGAKTPIPAPAKPSANHKIIDGVEIYFGVTSADLMRKQHPGNDPESAMHGGIPRGSDYYHLNITLLNAETKAAIKGARVEVKVTDPVMGDQVKTLESVTINNTVSYGNYFQLPGKYPYSIAVQIRKPGAVRPIETKFGFRE